MKQLLLVLAPVICLASPVQAELMPVGKTGWYSSFDSITFSSIPFWYGKNAQDNSYKRMNVQVGCDEMSASGLNIRFKQRVKAASASEASGVFVEASSPAELILGSKAGEFTLRALHRPGSDSLSMGVYSGVTPDELFALVKSIYKTSNATLILPRELRLELHPLNASPPPELRSKEALTRAMAACQALLKR
jgi:hypothetical protein